MSSLLLRQCWELSQLPLSQGSHHQLLTTIWELAHSQPTLDIRLVRRVRSHHTLIDTTTDYNHLVQWFLYHNYRPPTNLSTLVLLLVAPFLHWRHLLPVAEVSRTWLQIARGEVYRKIHITDDVHLVDYFAVKPEEIEKVPYRLVEKVYIHQCSLTEYRLVTKRFSKATVDVGRPLNNLWLKNHFFIVDAAKARINKKRLKSAEVVVWMGDVGNLVSITPHLLVLGKSGGFLNVSVSPTFHLGCILPLPDIKLDVSKLVLIEINFVQGRSWKVELPHVRKVSIWWKQKLKVQALAFLRQIERIEAIHFHCPKVTWVNVKEFLDQPHHQWLVCLINCTTSMHNPWKWISTDDDRGAKLAPVLMKHAHTVVISGKQYR